MPPLDLKTIKSATSEHSAAVSEDEKDYAENPESLLEQPEPVSENRKEKEDLKVNDLAIVERKTYV